jgi:hypothetical protein
MISIAGNVQPLWGCDGVGLFFKNVLLLWSNLFD